MVRKTQLKQILKLKQKKHRLANGLFVAEGEKTVREFISASWPCKILFSLENNFHPQAQKVDLSFMNQITHFKNPSPVLGVFEIPKPKLLNKMPITIAVDGIRDPGNLGAIIRLCDWFGINDLICSFNTVDCFNSKTVQASMGSLVRVTCHYLENLSEHLKSLEKPVFGADYRGKSIYSVRLPEFGSYVFGSESHGISQEINKLLDYKLSIPNYRQTKGAESLNVATATAIFLSEIYRKT